MSEKIYTFFKSHKWVMYVSLCVTVVLFAVLGMQCKFEENIAKLLPPTSDNLTVDLAFSDLKVKDKIFIQITGREGKEVAAEDLAAAMDSFMERLLGGDVQHNIESTLYQVDLEQLLSLAPWLLEHAPQYLDFTDAEMDSLTSAEHIGVQIEQYLGYMETDLGMQLYDYMAYDPAGIVMSKVQPLLAGGGQSPLKNGHLFSKDGTVCMGYVNPHLSSMDSGSAGKLLKQIKKAKAEVEKEFADVEVLYHGTVIMSANNARRIKTDLLYTIGIALIIILLLLGWCFRQVSSNVLLLLPVIYGALFALAGIFVVQGGMSVMALGIGAIVLGVALSYCLHVMVEYKYTGDALLTVKDQAWPVFLGSLTTIGAFAGLLFTQSSLLRDFGLFAVFAMVGTTVASLWFMPQFFPKTNKVNRRAFELMEKVNSYDLSKSKTALVLMVLFVGVCIAFSGKVHFDSNLKNINYIDPLVARSMQLYADKQNDGSFRQYFAAVAKTTDEALQELEHIEQVCDSLQREGVIDGYSKTSALMPTLERQQQRIEHWKQYFSPEKSRQVWANVEKACTSAGVEADMFLPFRELMSADFEPELLYEAGLLPDEIMSNLVERNGEYVLAFIPVRIHPDRVTEVNGILTKAAGCLVLDPFYYTIDTVAMMQQDFNTILGISAIFVLIVLLLSFRRLTVALIAFLPMSLSWYVVLGAMYLTGHEFNLINIVVSSFIFGIGVDYSIFMMDGLLRKAKGETEHLLTYHKTAITLSATILVICMVSLLFAKHTAMRSIGFASLVGMITTMLLTYTLEPWLLRQVLKVEWLRKKILGK